MASIATSNGYLDFLKELDTLGILENDSLLPHEDCILAIHKAAFNGHTDCLEYLVSRFGTHYLGFVDRNGMMPIHLARIIKKS